MFTLLKSNGAIILGAAMVKEMMLGVWNAWRQKKMLFIGEAKATADDMNFLKELVKSGQMRAVVDRTYSLEQMREAHQYVEQGHKKGNVAIRIEA
jgi:NADPH:quinone reductase-like Zn-dependent oxidoreductase